MQTIIEVSVFVHLYPPIHCTHWWIQGGTPQTASNSLIFARIFTKMQPQLVSMPPLNGEQYGYNSTNLQRTFIKGGSVTGYFVVFWCTDMKA